MAKAKTAKSSTVKVGDTKIKNATEADKANIALAEKSIANDTSTQPEDLPEAKRSAPAQRAAAKETFAKADARAEPQSRIDARAADKLKADDLAELQTANAARLGAVGF